jgi:hypothetical protein
VQVTMWDGVSGVPGLGYHIRRSYHEDNIYKEWNDKQHSYSSVSHLSGSNTKCKHQVMSSWDSFGYGRDSLHNSYSSTGDSHQSKSSSDYQPVNKSHSFAQVTQVSLFPKKNKSIIVNQHTKLQRTGVNKTKEIKPKVTFSELNDIQPAENNIHQKLSRTKDVTNSFSQTNPNMDTKKPYLDAKIIDSYLKEDDYAYAYR